MPGGAGQEGPAGVGGEAPRGAADRRRADEGEARQRQGVTWQAAHGAQHVVDDPVQPVDQRSDEVPVRRRVTAEVRRRLPHVAVQRGGAPAPQRVGEGDFGLAEHHAESGEVERPEEGRRDQRRVHGGTDVVAESREGQLLGARPAPDGRSAFVHLDPVAGPGQRERGSKSVGPRPHHDGVGSLHGPTIPTPTGRHTGARSPALAHAAAGQ